MSVTAIKKPRRLNIAALLNILLGILSAGAILFLVNDPTIREKLQLDSTAIWQGAILAALLLIGSVLVLLGIRNSHYMMLAAACFFYGAIIFQNAALLGSAEVLANDGGTTKLWANIVRKSLTLAFNAWAVFSAPSRAYFSRQR